MSSLPGPLGVQDTQHRDPDEVSQKLGDTSDLIARTFNSSSYVGLAKQRRKGNPVLHQTAVPLKSVEERENSHNKQVTEPGPTQDGPDKHLEG